jgi:molybdopterin/thiamine biosynthesis adenylyltransferase
MPEVVEIKLVDFDVYTASNLLNQAIDTSAPGKTKVEVQAALIHAINPQMRVDAIESQVENVPLARLDSSVLLACVDRRSARQTINRIAWRLGKPWIDAAVGAPSLVRINTYVPGESAPCIECSWDERSYDLLEQEYPCDAGAIPVPATGTAAELGTLAASLQVGELRRLLGNTANDASLVGAQLMIDTATYASHLCRFKRNEQCRAGHDVWKVEAVVMSPQESTLADLFDAVDAGSDSAISLEGHSFATTVDCVACDRRSAIGLSIYGRLSVDERTCSCGGRMFAPGFFSFEAIRRSDLSATNMGLTLAALGLQSGDVISVTEGPGTARHIEIRDGAVQ